jgi:hypothetical protein
VSADDALDLAARLGGELIVPFALDCLALVAAEEANHLLAARHFGAAGAARQRMGMVRFKVFDEGDEAKIAAVREALGENDFEAAWAEGAAMSMWPKAWATRKSPRGCSSHRAPCRPTSRTSTPNWDSPRACSSPKRPRAMRSTRCSSHFAHFMLCD